MLKGVTAGILVLMLASCARTVADFQPYSSREFRRVVQRAMLAYEGDLSALAQAGGEIVGNVYVNGNGFADSEDIRGRALDDAAAVGGTHLIIAGESSSTNWAQITPDRTTTTAYGNTATTTYVPGAQIPITRLSGAFVVISVPPDRWQDLPRALQPPGTKWTAPHPRALSPGLSASRPLTDGWYCTADMHDSGLCFRSNSDCQQTQQELASYGLAPCRAYATAWCYSSSRANRKASLACSPSMNACRAQRDYSMGQGEQILLECTVSQ